MVESLCHQDFSLTSASLALPNFYTVRAKCSVSQTAFAVLYLQSSTSLPGARYCSSHYKGR